jgi:hypothetical protein
MDAVVASKSFQEAQDMGMGAAGGSLKLLGRVKIHQHHIFAQKFRDFFRARGIDIDKFIVEISEGRHLKSIHGRGDAITPGGFNQRWSEFIEANPNATAKEVFQFWVQFPDFWGKSV